MRQPLTPNLSRIAICVAGSVSDEDYFDACELTELMGVKAIEMLDKAKEAFWDQHYTR